MNENIGLLLVGKKDWYDNISASFQKYKKTWIQQSQLIKTAYIAEFETLISKNGFFYAFGYVQAPNKVVKFRFKIKEIQHSNTRIAPPDETAPPFGWYDIEQGHCKNEEDYKYKMWLKVTELDMIEPKNTREFINHEKGAPIENVARGKAHYIVKIPHDIIIEHEGEGPSEGSTNETSFHFENDLKNFIRYNLDFIEKGLKLYKEDKEFTLTSGKRIDILCLDQNKDFVVIELKANIADENTYTQIKLYIAELRSLKIAENKKIRGFIIAHDFNENLIKLVKIDNDIKLFEYKVNFTFTERKISI